MDTLDIQKNLQLVKSSIADSIQKSGRAPLSVQLVAVSKFHDVSKVISAISAGQMVFGENYVAEARDKWASLKTQLSPEVFSNIELHLIGHLQKNKVKTAVAISSFIDSVDSIALLELLEKESQKQNKILSVLLELSSGEETKTGFCDTQSLDSATELFSKGIFPHLKLRGFMTMAPLSSNIDDARVAFKNLADFSKRAALRYQNLSPFALSMGMSSDYKIAIEMGATEVRVGSAIFGERPIKNNS